MKNKTEIKSLLRTILEEAKRNKVMFRYSALNHYEWENYDYIDDWGYDIDRVIEVMLGWDIGIVHNIQFLQAKKVCKDNKKTVNIKTLKDFLEKKGYKVGKKTLSYSLNCDTKFFGITIDDEDNAYQLDNDESASVLLQHDAWLYWELYNTGIDCFIDYSVGLDNLFKNTSLEIIQDEWEDKFCKFEKGLL